jgi:serine/threonine protein kinase
MIDDDDRIVLTDFGIAKNVRCQAVDRQRWNDRHTRLYVLQSKGWGRPVDDRSDIYSLGVIMYQLLVGSLPYDAETALGVILMHVNDPIPEVRAFVSWCFHNRCSR